MIVHGPVVCSYSGPSGPVDPLARAYAGARQLLVHFALRDGVAHTGATLEDA